MKKTSIFAFVLLITLSSCGTAVKTLSGFKNPKVQNKSELANYFKEVMPNDKTYFLTVEKYGDSAAIYDSFFFGFTSEIKIFNKKGQEYCYNGTESCSGTQLSSAFTYFDKMYQPCTVETNDSFSKIVAKLTDNFGNKIEIEEFSNSDYFIFQKWNTYSSSKKRLKQDFQWISNLKENATVKTTIIFVNGDLLEEWGLEKNGELPIKFKKIDKQFTLNFGKLPTKK
jgi:hypothetical protein